MLILILEKKSSCSRTEPELRARGANRTRFITYWRKSAADVNFHISVDFAEATWIHRS